MTKTAWRVADVLARAVGVVRCARKILRMAGSPSLEELCKAVALGSPWAALALARRIHPTSAEQLARAAGVHALSGRQRVRAFDACADAYVVFDDARRRGAL